MTVGRKVSSHMKRPPAEPDPERWPSAWTSLESEERKEKHREMKTDKNKINTWQVSGSSNSKSGTDLIQSYQ